MAEAPPSFDSVYEEHAPRVGRLVRRMGVPPEDLEDVLQDVFLSVFRGLPGFEGRASLGTWVYRIGIRVALEHRKRKRKRPIGELTEGSGAGPAAEGQVVAKLTIDRLLDALDDDKRLVFVLFEIERLPMNEIAALAGCPPKTAYARLYAAQAELRAQIRRFRLTDEDL